MLKKLSLHASVAITSLLVAAPPAIAQSRRSVGEIAQSLQQQTTAVNTFLTVLPFVIGVGMAIGGFLKFRAHSQNPNDPSNKLSTAFMLLFVGAGLVAIPAVLGTGIETIFGNGQQTDATGGFNAVN